MSELRRRLARGAASCRLIEGNAQLDGAAQLDGEELWREVATAAARDFEVLPRNALHVRPLRNDIKHVIAALACIEARRTLVLFDPLWTDAERREATVRVAAMRFALDDVAVVHWSSGSTGRPKPIAVPRDALAARIESVIEAFAIGPGDRVLAMVPLNHCHGFDCIALPTLAAGAELVLLDPLQATPEMVTRLVARHRLTHVSALPRFWEQLVASSIEPDSWRSVKQPLCGSAALRPACSRAFAERFGIAVRTGYGVTEIGVISLERQDGATPRHDSVGRVLPGIDWRLVACAESGAGELEVRGPGLGRVDLDGMDGGPPRLVDGWLRTHDVVRVDADGRLKVVGRQSSFINVNGTKVDPREVEEAIAELPFVAECAVKGVADSDGSERVEAWIVARPLLAPTDIAAALRAGVAARLSLAKVPTQVHSVAQLPRNSLGKVLYPALCSAPPPTLSSTSSPPSAAAGAAITAAPAGTSTERQLAAIWAAVLGRATVGLDDGFFAAGGDSAGLLRLLERLRGGLAPAFTLADLFRHPTIRTQAAALERRDRPVG